MDEIEKKWIKSFKELIQGIKIRLIEILSKYKQLGKIKLSKKSQKEKFPDLKEISLQIKSQPRILCNEGAFCEVRI